MEPEGIEPLGNGSTVREFRGRPIPRYVYLMAVGCILLIVIMIGVFVLVAARDGFREALGLSALIGVVAAGWLLNVVMHLSPSICRARVDQEGVHYRGLFGWTLWSWAEFESGEVQQYGRFCFYDRCRPAFRRTLRIDVFENREALLEACLEHWNPPTMVVPESIELTLFPRSWGGEDTRLRFSGEGIRVTERGKETAYVWRDVSGIAIEHATRDQRDFTEATLGLPDRTVAMRRWQGPRFLEPRARVIEAFLRQHVEEDRIHVEFGDSPRRKLERVEKQLIRASSNIRRDALFVGAFLGFLGGLVGWRIAGKFLGFGTWAGLVTGLEMGIPAAIVGYAVTQGNRRRRVAELEAERDRLLALLEHEKTREDGDGRGTESADG